MAIIPIPLIYFIFSRKKHTLSGFYAFPWPTNHGWLTGWFMEGRRDSGLMIAVPLALNFLLPSGKLT